jgi:APA family basic amino acid/polyamine antiporter
VSTSTSADEPRKLNLVRALGRGDLTALAINGIIGAGIFGLPSAVAALLGNASPIAFVACAAIVGIIVLCFAEIASRFTDTGGPYLYARSAFGPLVGFEVGWAVWLARVSAFAANANLLISYFGFFVPQLSVGVGRIVSITVVVALLAGVNVRGVAMGAHFGDAFAILKLLPLVAFGIVGMFFVDWGTFSPIEAPTSVSFGSAVLLLVYAFTGFEYAAIPAAEARNPRKDISWALIYALGIAAVIYLAVQIVAVGTYPALAQSERPLADAGQAFLGPVAGGVMALAALVSIMGNLSAVMLIGPRLTYAFAEQGEFPAFLGYLHSRFRTPIASIALFAVLVWMLALSGTFVWLATISVVARIGAYMVSCAAVPILRKRSLTRPEFQLMFGPLFPILAIVLGIWLYAQTNVADTLAFLVAVLVGSILYFGMKAKKTHEGDP